MEHRVNSGVVNSEKRNFLAIKRVTIWTWGKIMQKDINNFKIKTI